MKAVPESQQSDELISQLSEQELMIIAHVNPLVARMIVRSPQLLAKISKDSRPSFLCRIALVDEQTARLIFSHLNVKKFFPAGVNSKKSMLQRIFRQHKTLEYKLLILFHCDVNFPDARQELCGILLKDMFMDRVQLHAVLFSFFVMRHTISYLVRVNFLNNMLSDLKEIGLNPAGINKKSLAILMKEAIDLRSVLEEMPPLTRLPAPLIARIRTDIDEKTAQNFDKGSPSWLMAMLKDEVVWKALLNFDYPESTVGAMTPSAFYKERRTLDKLHAAFDLVRMSGSQENIDQAAGALIEKLYTLTLTGDQYCCFFYVDFFTENILEEMQNDTDFFDESNYCLEMLQELIRENYRANDCYQLQDRILNFLASLEDYRDVAAQKDPQDVTTEEEIETTEKVDSNDSETENSLTYPENGGDTPRA